MTPSRRRQNKPTTTTNLHVSRPRPFTSFFIFSFFHSFFFSSLSLFSLNAPHVLISRLFILRHYMLPPPSATTASPPPPPPPPPPISAPLVSYSYRCRAGFYFKCYRLCEDSSGSHRVNRLSLLRWLVELRQGGRSFLNIQIRPFLLAPSTFLEDMLMRECRAFLRIRFLLLRGAALSSYSHTHTHT
jgi:hypothetical protein